MIEEAAQLPSRYHVERMLGDGAEGGACLALDHHAQDRRVVIKGVSRERLGGLRATFGLLRRGGSPHLPEPVAIHVEEGSPRGWLVTAYIDGDALRPGPAPLASVLSELLGVARALDVVHALGTHHGDVSLSNVIRTPTGGIVLSDFGTLGATGTGTPGFLAPEVLAGGGGPAADLFALGCVACARLYGAVPWRRPEQLVAWASGRDAFEDRGRGAAARLDALDAAADRTETVPEALRQLVEHLLEPEPERRPVAIGAVIRRLEQIEHACRAGVQVSAVRWAVPRQPAFIDPLDAEARGGLDRAIARLCDPGDDIGDRPGLIAVAGPAGAGRSRIVREVVATLQHRGTSAEVTDGESAPSALGHGDLGLLAAWVAGEREGLVGVVGPYDWDLRLHDVADDDDRATRTAKSLIAAARLARTTLVLPVDPATAEALLRSAEGDPRVLVVEVHPWSETRIGSVVDAWLRTDDERLAKGWAQAIATASGGWPGAVVRALQHCAREGYERPSSETEAKIGAALLDGSFVLAPEQARAVLEVRWGLRAPPLPDPRLDGLAGGGVITGRVAAAARIGLGGDLAVADLATATLEALVAREAEPSLRLALDADDAQWIVKAGTRAVGEVDVAGSTALDLDDLAAWIDRHARVGSASQTSVTIPVSLRRSCASRALARGDAELALRLSEGVEGCRIEYARALHRRGDASSAHAALRSLADDPPPENQSGDAMRLAARALSWRVAIDLGRGGEAAREATLTMFGRRFDPARISAAAVTHGLGRLEATLLGGTPQNEARLVVTEVALWGGMALVYAGEVAAGRTCLEVSLARTGPAGPKARSLQLLGNLALSGGDQQEAARHFSAAKAAFETAGEAAVQYLIDGSLAAVAWHLGDVVEAQRLARRALGAALARAQTHNVVACFHNLALGWMATGHTDLARRELAAVRRAVGAARAGEMEATDRARLDRIEADLLAARLGAPGRSEAAAAFRRSAARLLAAGSTVEAADAWLEASDRARKAGDLKAARDDLTRALALVGEHAPLELRLRAALSCLLAANDVRTMDEAAQRLAALPGPDALRRSGQLRLAWSYDRTLLAVVRRVHGRGHPRGLAAAQRLYGLLETLLNKVEPMDRTAAMERLVTDDGDPAPLRALLDELDGRLGTSEGLVQAVAGIVPGGGEPRGGSPGAPQSDGPNHLEAMVRGFRRLARESDFERLLEQVVEVMMDLTDAERGAVVAVTEDGRRIHAARELAGDGEGVQYSSSVIDRVLAEGEPVLSVDASSDARFDESKSISHLNLRSVLAVPLRAGGRLIGAAYVDHRLRRGAFTERDLAQVEDFADLAALAVAHARSLEALRSRTVVLDEQRRQLEARLEASRAELTGLREQVRASSAQTERYRGMIGASPAMHHVFRLVDRLADSDVPVVIHGESGTGKELVARAIHGAGGRADQPFVAENCSAIPEALLESVLFGHAKGAFTGAHQAKPGLFEAAHGGTIFLDEVGEMSPSMQTKLLRVLQEGEVRRVGENASRRVDVRVLAASNRDLEQMVEDGDFRRDLYYRICVVKVELPPLRARREDLAPLVESFLDRHGGQHLEVSAAAMRALARYPWPGNVRELENEVQRWVALVEDRVRQEDLGAPIRNLQVHDAVDPDDLRLKPRVELLERDLIRQALERTQGNQTQAAQLLGLSRYGLQKKLKRLEEPDDATPAEGA